MHAYNVCSYFARSFSKWDRAYLLAESRPGAGKTSIPAGLLPRMIAEAHGYESPASVAVVFHNCAASDPDDISGFPMPAKNASGEPITVRTRAMIATTVDNLWTNGTIDANGVNKRVEHIVLVLDEVRQNDALTQTSLTQIMRERKIKDRSLHHEDGRKVSVLCFSNRMEDQSCVVESPAMLKDGGCLISWDLPIASWQQWAVNEHGMDPAFVGFTAREIPFNTHVPSDNGKMCTERGLTYVWDMFASMYGRDMPDIRAAVVADKSTAVGEQPGDLAQLVYGFIGEAQGRKLMDYLINHADLVSWDELLADPHSVPLTTLDRSYSYITVLTSRLGLMAKNGEPLDDVMEPVYVFIRRLPQEIRTAAVKAIRSATGNKSATTKAHTQYVVEYGQDIMEATLPIY